MRSLSNIGRIFYGISMAGIGFQIIYYRDFPYWLIPPKHDWIPSLSMFAFIFGIMFVLTGVCIVFEKRTKTISLLTGTILLLIFCFYFIPYQFMSSARYI